MMENFDPFCSLLDQFTFTGAPKHRRDWQRRKHRIFAYLFRRALTLFLVLLGLAILIFVIARIVPGDPARIGLGPLATAQQVSELRGEMGPDDPFIVQLWMYLKGLVQGDLGKSLLTSRPVRDDILGALPATLELVLFTIVIQIGVSIPFGVLAAVYRNTWIDKVLRIVSLIGVVTPGFVLAILLQLVAAHYLGFFPVTGRLDGGIEVSADITGLLVIDGILTGRVDVVMDALRHLFLPAIALAAGGIGQVMRIMRTAMIEVASRDFVEASRAYGIPERVVTFRYMLRVASVAPLTILGLEFASLIGNAFIVEFVFSWPGIASYGVRTILHKDLNAVVGVVLVSGVFFAVPVGVVLSLVAGYFGGWIETIVMRFTDIMLALPPLAMALAITAVLSPNLINAMIAITLLWWTWHTRLIYRIVKAQMNEDYVVAARVAGASHAHFLFRELLPICFSAVAVKTSLDAGFVILFGAALSFLGLGVQPPTPDLGTMVASGSENLPEMWWQAAMPGLAILYATLGFNLLGDGLRDMLHVDL